MVSAPAVQGWELAGGSACLATAQKLSGGVATLRGPVAAPELCALAVYDVTRCAVSSSQTPSKHTERTRL